MEMVRNRDPEDEMHRELERLAQKHIDGPLNLTLLDYNPEKYEDQQLTYVRKPIAEGTNLETISQYATVAAGEIQHPGRFDYLVQAFSDKPEILDKIRQMTNEGKHIALITNHSLLHDIAIAQAALVVALGDEKLISRNAIVISKLITRFKAFGLPATSVLSNLAHSFFSVPRTKSILRSGIDNDVATIANKAMRRELGHFLDEPEGKLVAIAPSGSTDEREIVDGELHKLTLQRMSSGTATLLTHFDAVLPVAIWLEAEEDRRTVSVGELVEMETEDDAHAGMQWMAREVSHLSGITTSYESERLGGMKRLRRIGQQAVERAEQAFRRD